MNSPYDINCGCRYFEAPNKIYMAEATNVISKTFAFLQV